MNICGEFITHKIFGRGQITENQDGVVTVLFSDSKDIKKFIFPAAIEQYLKLENAATANEYRIYSDGIASASELAKKDAAERLAIEKNAIKEHTKLLKKTTKKPVKKVKDNYDFNFEKQEM